MALESCDLQLTEGVTAQQGGAGQLDSWRDCQVDVDCPAPEQSENVGLGLGIPKGASLGQSAPASGPTISAPFMLIVTRSSRAKRHRIPYPGVNREGVDAWPQPQIGVAWQGCRSIAKVSTHGPARLSYAQCPFRPFLQ